MSPHLEMLRKALSPLVAGKEQKYNTSLSGIPEQPSVHPSWGYSEAWDTQGMPQHALPKRMQSRHPFGQTMPYRPGQDAGRAERMPYYPGQDNGVLIRALMGLAK